MDWMVTVVSNISVKLRTTSIKKKLKRIGSKPSSITIVKVKDNSSQIVNTMDNVESKVENNLQRTDYATFANLTFRIFLDFISGNDEFKDLKSLLIKDRSTVQNNKLKNKTTQPNFYRCSPFQWYYNDNNWKHKLYTYNDILILDKHSGYLIVWALEKYFRYLMENKINESDQKSLDLTKEKLESLKEANRNISIKLKFFSAIIGQLDIEFVLSYVSIYIRDETNWNANLRYCVRSIFNYLADKFHYHTKINISMVKHYIKSGEYLAACNRLSEICCAFKYRKPIPEPALQTTVQYFNIANIQDVGVHLDEMYMYISEAKVEQTFKVFYKNDLQTTKDDAAHIVLTSFNIVFDVIYLRFNGVVIDLTNTSWFVRLAMFKKAYPIFETINLTFVPLRRLQYNHLPQTQYKSHTYIKTIGFGQGTHFDNITPKSNKRNQKTPVEIGNTIPEMNLSKLIEFLNFVKTKLNSDNSNDEEDQYSIKHNIYSNDDEECVSFENLS